MHDAYWLWSGRMWPGGRELSPVSSEQGWPGRAPGNSLLSCARSHWSQLHISLWARHGARHTVTVSKDKGEMIECSETQTTFTTHFGVSWYPDNINQYKQQWEQGRLQWEYSLFCTENCFNVEQMSYMYMKIKIILPVFPGLSSYLLVLTGLKYKHRHSIIHYLTTSHIWKT